MANLHTLFMVFVNSSLIHPLFLSPSTSNLSIHNHNHYHHNSNPFVQESIVPLDGDIVHY